MPYTDPQHFSVVDPREFDGDPYEVAERAVAQLAGVLAVADKLVEPTILMTRNAELERQLVRGEEPDAAGWPSTVEGDRWQGVRDRLLGLRNELNILKRVASFNPKKAG